MRPRDVPTAVGILMSMISFGLRAAEPQPLMFHVPGLDRNQAPIPPITRNPNGSAACQFLNPPRSGTHGALRKHVGLLGASPYQVSILPQHESLTKMPAHFLRFMLSALHWRKPFL
jgi:hypothetical protein